MRSPEAVCTSSLGKRSRRRNPERHVLVIQAKSSHRAPIMFYGKSSDGTHYSFNNLRRPKIFRSRDEALRAGTRLLLKFPQLSKYSLWTQGLVAGSRTDRRYINPQQRGLDVAARKLEDFTGHAPTRKIRAGERSSDKTGLVIGELDLIGYKAAREGIAGGRMQRWGHQFKKDSRPLLAVSSDGKQLHIVGGRYEFTEAGIEDR